MKRAIGVALTLALLFSTNACHGGTTAAGGASGPDGSATVADGVNTSPVDPIVTAALSADAEKGGAVGASVDPRTLTPTELQFGRSPKLDPNVTYAPGVVVMEHGDTALRSMDSNGLVWHFSASAPQVDQIVEGATIFATERCVGKVVHVERKGDDVAATIAPVQITDVIAKAHFVYDQPVDLNSLVAAAAPDLPITFTQDTPAPSASGAPTDTPSGTPSDTPGASPTDVPSAATTASIRHYRLISATYAMVTPSGEWKPYRVATYDARGRVHLHDLRPMAERVAQVPGIPGAPAGVPNVPNVPTSMATDIPAPMPSVGDPKPINLNGLDVIPCASSCGGFGVKLLYNKNGVVVDASVVFFLNNPSLHFNVDISNGIRTVGITLKGAAGFKASFEVGADKSFNGNIHQSGNVPFDISIPISNFGVPIAVHLIQSLSLDTGFRARNSILKSSIAFKACCELSVGYFNGSWGGSTPTVGMDFGNTNVDGMSLGLDSLAFGLRQEVLVGIGAFGFSSGPYMALTSGVGFAKQSSIVLNQCKQAMLQMDFSAGVGWTAPGPVVNVINVFLKAINAAPMTGSGSILEMKPTRMVTYQGSVPKGCAK